MFLPSLFIPKCCCHPYLSCRWYLPTGDIEEIAAHFFALIVTCQHFATSDPEAFQHINSNHQILQHRTRIRTR
jgi:hypothetical protein